MRSSAIAVLATALLSACGGSGGGTTTPDCAGPSCIVAVATGSQYSCALRAGGEVRCWGTNGFGQVGNVDVPLGGIYATSLEPVPVTSLAGATALGAGDLAACAVAGGAVKCWGYNGYRQLGTATPLYRSWADAVPGLSGASAVAGGNNHACALVGGRVKCWGTNNWGQLGDGTTSPSYDPITVPTLAGVSAIATGTGFTCALVSGGGLRCWGANHSGQLGNATVVSTYSVEPVQVTTIAGARAIAAGGGFSCALAGDGTVRCWGDDNYGQLGVQVAGTSSADPVTVASVSGATALATGFRHACAIVAGGAVRCWGDNSYGQLGNGTLSGATAIDAGYAPELVTSLSGATAISCGYAHSCAVVGKTGVKCWGWNDIGQLGDGTQIDRPAPADVVF